MRYPCLFFNHVNATPRPPINSGRFTSVKDGVEAIEFGLVLFVQQGNSRLLLNTTAAGATVLINPKTGQVIVCHAVLVTLRQIYQHIRLRRRS